MLRKLFEGFPFLHDTISSVVLQKYRLSLDELPPREDEKACAAFEAKLCRDYIAHKFVEVASCEGDSANRDTMETGGPEEPQLLTRVDNPLQLVGGLFVQ
jgi:hypothetical protein